MGSPENEQDRQDNEGPQTEVTLTQAFWMGKFEVTQGEYEAVMGVNPSFHNGPQSNGIDYGVDPNRPVETVSWDDAVVFCSSLTRRERAVGRIPSDYSYRLPTEAEWEYACRAGSTTRFSYGNDPDHGQLVNYAWYDGNSEDTSHPVGQRLPNPWGLYDMHGNVLEWCQDLMSQNLPGGNVVDPKGPDQAVLEDLHQYRGGSFASTVSYPYGDASRCRSAVRGGVHTLPPDRSARNLGFRIILSRVRQ